MDHRVLAQTLVNGLLIGGVYAIVALGLNLIYGVMGIINFSHGAMLMLSMYTSYFMFSLFGLDPLVSLPLVAMFLFLLGIVIQTLLIDRILTAPTISRLIATFGLLIFLENLALLLWSPNWRCIKTAYSVQAINLGGVLVSVPRLLAFVIALLLAGVLYLTIAKTDIGIAIRATAQNKRAAALMGINVPRIYKIVFGIGLASTGIAGGLLMTFYYTFPTVGLIWALTAYIACVLGGLGSFAGAIAGGLIIGVAESFGAIVISPAFKNLISFAAFIIVLLLRPQGIFGRK